MAKGNITLFIIAFLLIIITIGFVYSYMASRHNRTFIDSGLDAASVGADSSLNTYITECLMSSSLEGVEIYGLSDSDELKTYIELSIIECVEDFKIIYSYEITYDLPDVRLIFDERNAIFSLILPIRAKKGNSVITLSEFTYSLDTFSSIPVKNGVIKKGSQIFSPDGKASIYFPEDTKLENFDAERLSLGMLDKHHGGLSNKAVFGSTIYRGEPEGIVFDPAPKIRIRLPPGAFDEASSGIIYLSYLDDSEIWYSLPNSRIDMDKGMLEADLPHFSEFAATISPTSYIYVSYADPYTSYKANTIEGPRSSYEYKSLFNLKGWSDPRLWNFNFKYLDGGWRIDTNGIHLLPEFMYSRVCIPGSYDANFITEPEFLDSHCLMSKDNQLLGDWDDDDNAIESIDPNEAYKEYNYMFYNRGGYWWDYEGMSGDELYEISLKSAGTYSYDNAVLEAEKECYIQAKEYALKKLSEYFINYENIKDYFSGDGINDNAVIPCHIKKGSNFNEFEGYFKYDIKIEAEKITDDEYSLYMERNNLNNLVTKSLYPEYQSGFMTSELYFPSIGGYTGSKGYNRIGFFATPKTIGYSGVSKFDGDMPNSAYSAAAEFSFNLAGGGDTSIHDVSSELSLSARGGEYRSAVLLTQEDKAVNEITVATLDGKIASGQERVSIFASVQNPAYRNYDYHKYLIWAVPFENVFSTRFQHLLPYGIKLSSTMEYDPVTTSSSEKTSCSDYCVWEMNSGDKEGMLNSGENKLSVSIMNNKDAALFSGAVLMIGGKIDDMASIGKGVIRLAGENCGMAQEGPENAEECNPSKDGKECVWGVMRQCNSYCRWEYIGCSAECGSDSFCINKEIGESCGASRSCGWDCRCTSLPVPR